ncbi:MAG TPA: O-phospho-L-seryl-tRNA:Cys-tRNA synthase [bacterium]|nr:O-phospho-L-seryl-tRNA:Cys-tRNA synthase [bacterium]
MSYERVAIDELMINLNPLQTAGRASAAVRKAVARFSDGYSVCDRCEGVLHDIEKPDIKGFTAELAEFIGADRVAVTMGAREGKFAVMHSVANPGDTIVVDGNAHYTTFMAAQRAGLETFIVPGSGSPEYSIPPQGYAEAFEQCKSATGKLPALALLTHVDGSYGNLSDAAAVAKVCHDAGVPVVLNAAYSAGRMPVNARELGVDFIVASGHKSFGASGPVGFMGAVGEWADRLFRLSPTHPKKNIELLGCTARGSNIIALMTALPIVKKRILNWPAEVEKTRRFVEGMEKIGDIFQEGVKPKQHDLIRFDTPLYHRIGERHRKRGYFLSSELADRGITGLKPGQTKWFKVSTYGYSDAQIDYILASFAEIAEM